MRLKKKAKKQFVILSQLLTREVAGLKFKLRKVGISQSH